MPSGAASTRFVVTGAHLHYFRLCPLFARMVSDLGRIDEARIDAKRSGPPFAQQEQRPTRSPRYGARDLLILTFL